MTNKYGERKVRPRTFKCGIAHDGSELTREEIEFGKAMLDFKHHTGKINPTCADILDVAYSLGYRKVRSPNS